MERGLLHIALIKDHTLLHAIERLFLLHLVVDCVHEQTASVVLMWSTVRVEHLANNEEVIVATQGVREELDRLEQEVGIFANRLASGAAKS